MKIKLLVLGMVGMILSGCATVPIADGIVHNGIAVHYGTPNRPYKELGIVSAGERVFQFSTGAGAVLNNLVEEARKLGADAIIEIRIDQPKWYETGSGVRGTAKAVKWVDNNEVKNRDSD